jgi:hypothetical protein
MTELPATWARTAKIFWALTWRSVVLMLVVGFVFGLVWRGVMSYLVVAGFATSPEAGARWLHITRGLLVVGLIFLALRWVLDGRWSDFRIALVHLQETDATVSAKETNVGGV